MASVTDEGASARLARFIGTAKEQSIPPVLVQKSAMSLLDCFGLALAARDEATVKACHSICQPLAQDGKGARVWGHPSTVSVLDAVMTNALATHARFQDDCDMTSWAHPGSLIVPGAVGVGELVGATVPEILRAVLVGYTTLNWLGADEIVGRAIVDRGFRASPTLGSIAAAATASVILGLDVEQSKNAIGIAADSTGGVLEPVRAGAADWRVQNATAAHRGTLAALLASRGVIGPDQPLEGPAGFLRAFAGMNEPPPSWEKDPNPEAVLTVWSKPYPTLGDNIAVVSTALSMREFIGDSTQIESVTVHQNAHFASYPGTSFRGPFTKPSQGMASTAFATAATLLYGQIRYQIYSTHLADAAISDLISRIRVVPEKSYGYLDATVEIALKDGRKISKSASDLPRSLFFRDKESSELAFKDLLNEVGYPADFARDLPSMVLDPTVRSVLPVRELVDALNFAAITN